MLKTDMLPKAILLFSLAFIALLFSSCAQIPVTPDIVSNTATISEQVQTSTPERRATLVPTREPPPTQQEQGITFDDYGFHLTPVAGYQQEFFEPEENSAGSETLVPPTPTPFACLDEAVQPIELPPRQTPLEVWFVSDGNLWVWVEGEPRAQQISDTGDAQTFSYAPDGQVIAFTRGELDSQAELWAINRDGSDLLLVSRFPFIYHQTRSISPTPGRRARCQTTGSCILPFSIDLKTWGTPRVT